MTKQELCEEIAEILEIDDELSLHTDLKQYVGFDSLAIMSIVALVFSCFQKKISGNDLQKVSTVNDLVKLIGEENF